jgi:RNA polymerase-binding transcription factor DksA
MRYSDEDLQEFKTLVEEKLQVAQEDLNHTERQIADLNENGFNQQGGDWYDDSTAHTDLEMLQRVLTRQQRFVVDLKNALLRIQNKTYGVCSVTGKLISKERLRLVPHATKSIDGKNIANANQNKEIPNYSSSDPYSDQPEDDKTTLKSVSDKLRVGGKTKRNTEGNDDWEPDNDTMEDAGYNDIRKFTDNDE